MEDIFQEIVRIRSEGQGAVLATVISAKGSTPRETGAKMLIRSDGTVLGSIGGVGVHGLLRAISRNGRRHNGH